MLHCIIPYSQWNNKVCLCLSEHMVQTEKTFFFFFLLLCNAQVYFGEGKLEHDAAVTVQWREEHKPFLRWAHHCCNNATQPLHRVGISDLQPRLHTEHRAAAYTSSFGWSNVCLILQTWKKNNQCSLFAGALCKSGQEPVYIKPLLIRALNLGSEPMLKVSPQASRWRW